MMNRKEMNAEEMNMVNGGSRITLANKATVKPPRTLPKAAFPVVLAKSLGAELADSAKSVLENVQDGSELAALAIVQGVAD